MSRGDYSPTVRAAYRVNPDWHKAVADESGMESRYDADGYDMYGYDIFGIDRAGFSTAEYDENSIDFDDCGFEYNADFDRVLKQWSFDGINPVEVTK